MIYKIDGLLEDLAEERDGGNFEEPSKTDDVELQSHKSFRTKVKLARAQKQNRPIPQWIRLRTGNTIRYANLHSNNPSSSDDHTRSCRGFQGHGRRERKTNKFRIDTTRRGGIGVRLALVSERIALYELSSNFCTSSYPRIPYTAALLTIRFGMDNSAMMVEFAG